MEADASTLDMPSDCCYFVDKAAAAGAAPAFQYFDSIFHHFAVVTQNLGQTQSLQGNLRLKSHLSFHADIHKDTAILTPTADTFQIAGAALIVNNKWSDTVSETFFEHEESADASVAVFEWADTFELHMEIQNLVKANVFL